MSLNSYIRLVESVIKKSVFGAALTVLAVVASTLGQEHSAMSADQTLRSNARVNPSSLGMELNIPLAGYPGRGIGASVSLSYSSKIWRMENVGFSPIGNTSICKGLSIPRFAELSAAGWTTDAAIPYLEYTGIDNPYDENGKPVSDPPFPCATAPVPQSIVHVRRIIVHMPGGGTHELRASTDLLVSQSAGTYDVNNVSWNTMYYSADGSNLIYEQNSSTSTYRLYLPDGSRIDYGSTIQYTSTLATERTIRRATQIRDASGNTLVYHAADSSHPNGYTTDTMGRAIDVPLGLTAPSSPTVAGVPQQYVVPGMTGSAGLTYGLHWRRLEDVLTNTSDVLCYLAYGFPFTGSPQPPTGDCKLFLSTSDSRVAMDPAVGVFNPVVLAQIDLPNGSSYKFHYDKYGTINKIEYPTGALETFDYSVVPTIDQRLTTLSTNVGDQANFGVTHREVLESTGVTPVAWNYAAVRTTTPSYTVTTDAPDGTKTEILLKQGNSITNYGFDSSLAGMPYDERFYDSSYNILSKKVSTYTAYTGTGYESHPRVTQVENIVYDPAASTSLSSSATTSYATISGISDPLLPVSVNAYGFTTSIGSLGSLQKTIETDYLSDSNYTARDLRGLPSEVRIKDASGNVKAKTQFTYDETGYQSSTTGTMPTAASGSWSDPTNSGDLGSTIGAKRGQATTVKSYYDIANSYYVETHGFYDQYGNTRKSRDARGNDTETLYDDDYAFAYPTSVTTAVPDSTGTYGSSTAFTSTSVFDYNTGLTTKVTDLNVLETRMEYDDSLLRQTKVTQWDGTTQVGSTTETSYGAGNTESTRWVKVRSKLDSTNWKEGYSWFDGLGRTIRSQSVDATNGDVFTMTCYDNMGRVQKATNPFRSYTSQTCSTTTGLDWTSNTYDAAGRPWKVTTPDGAYVETTYGVATSGTHIGTVVTVADQAGKLRRSVTNGLGQLARVDEPNSSNVLGSVSSPNQATTYSYDTLNNLKTVTQGSQTRTFTYNSLSRLKEATNPESGTIKYTYDDNGNLKTKWDARGIKTIYDYDALNRVWKRCYKSVGTTSLGYTTCADAASHSETVESNTPDVTYTYDAQTHAKGKLTKVSSSVSATEYTAFDILGRVTGHKQTTGGADYTTGYTYNLSGGLLTETYPSLRVVKNTIVANGDLSQVENKPSGGSYTTRASKYVYNAAGAVSSMQLGNSKYENTTFNNRLQPTRIGLGTTSSNSNILQLDYTYGTTDNNGNVQSQTITVPGVTYPLIQNYTYDSLNRLASATETSNSTQTWKQEFSYDRYGNRNFVTGTGHTTTLGSCTTMCDPAFSSTTNKITSSGYSYDASGNTTADPLSRTFVYDGENKQTSVWNGTLPIGAYYYDGDGKRIKKVDSTGTTLFFYDAMGRLVEESFASVPICVTQGKGEVCDTPAPVTTSYVYAGSRLLSTETSSGTNYLTADTLGSPRINTNASGSVVARHDYMPFGEEIATSQRTSGVGYAGDGVRKKFTGYERDNESDLDFAEARYYNKNHGRFTSVDPLMASASVGNPQTLNRYAYVGNNPINITDPSGLSWYFNSSIGEAGQYKWYEDNETPADGYHLVNGTSNHVYYAGEGVGYVALNPTANKFQTFDTQEAATKRVGAIYDCPSCQSLVNTVADESVKKGTTVAIAAGVAVAVGTGAGVAMAATGTAVGGTVTTLGLTGTGAATVEATGAVAVTFTSHGAVHAATEGFSQVAAESAIRAAVQNTLARAATSGEFWGKVTVGGSTIVYRAFTLADGTIRIGTYYDPTKK